MKAKTRIMARTVSQRTGMILGIGIMVLLFLIFIATAMASFSAGRIAGGALGNKAAGSLSLSKSPANAQLLRIIKVTRFTLRQALLSTLAALIVGLPAAWLVAKKKFFGRRFLSSLSAVSLCIPPLLMALAFVLSFGMNGQVNKLLMHITGAEEAPITFLYSFWGIIICHGFYNFPVIMRTVADTWQHLPEDEYNAARLLGASRPRIFRTVTIFQLLPAIASSCIIVFLYCFFSFIIVLLFGQKGSSTLEVEIYQAARSSLDFVLIGRLSLLETAIALFMVVVYALISKRGRHSTGLAAGQRTSIRGGFEWAMTIVILSVIGFFFLLPMVLLLWKALPAFGKVFARPAFFESLKNTLIVSVCTAALSTITAFAFAAISRLADPYKKSSLLRALPLVPMALSSVVLGFGITLLSNYTFLRGSPVLLVLAQSALTWPFALQQLRTPMDKIPLTVTEAASLLSPRPLDTVFCVLLPQCRRALFSAFAFCAAISSGDATLPLVLGIPGFDTLALFTYRLSGAYRFNESCASGAVLMFLSITLFIISDLTNRTDKFPRFQKK